MQPVCRMGRPICVIGYADAGKPCRGDADCEGKCLAGKGSEASQGVRATGFCQKNNNPCGCSTWIEDGMVAGTMCVD